MAGDEDYHYFLGADEDMIRLARNHVIIKAAMGGQLVLAPIDLTRPNLKVLDNGTSDGFWIQDFLKDYPPAKTVVGTDIDVSRFPKTAPEGVSFHQLDIREPYPEEWKGTFDLVHSRLVWLGAMGDPQPCITRACELVKPGGWIQMMEADQVVGETDGPATQQFLMLMKAMTDHMNIPFHFARDMGRYLKEAGFVKIGEMTVAMTHGAANPRPALREESVKALLQGVSGLIDFMLPSVPGVSPEEIETLPARIEEEARVHGNYYPLRAVWGQRPLQ